MRLKPMMLMGLASGCGLVAMFLFQQATKGSQGGQVDEKIPVLVVAAEVTPGTLLTEENVEFRDYPISVVPENVVTDPEEYEERAIRVRAFPGDFVTLDKLSRKGDHAASGDIPPGMVAITIPVDATMTSSGLLLPGDRVDVLVSFTMRGQFGGGKVIKTVLEFVEVFSVDQRREIETASGEAKAKTITLLVDPQQGMLVKLAEDIGKLHLAMRSKEDSTPRVADEDRFKPTDMTDLMGGDDEEEESEEESEEEDSDNDLENFLDDNSQPEPAPEPLPVAPTPEPLPIQPEVREIPTWQVEIFSGDIRRVDEVDLPESEWPAIEEPVTDEETAAVSTGNPLLDGLKAIFGGRGSKTKTETKTETPVSEPEEVLMPEVDMESVEDTIPVPVDLLN